jgi:hypothetical protein
MREIETKMMTGEDEIFPTASMLIFFFSFVLVGVVGREGEGKKVCFVFLLSRGSEATVFFLWAGGKPRLRRKSDGEEKEARGKKR